MHTKKPVEDKVHGDLLTLGLPARHSTTSEKQVNKSAFSVPSSHADLVQPEII